MWRARTLLGGEEWLGWSHAERQRADLADISVLTMKATAQQQARLRRAEYAARPEPPGSREAVSSSDEKGMAAMLGSIG